MTARELEILQALWGGSLTIKQLRDLLYPGGDAAEYGTVQKLLDRLEEKGYVSRDRSGPAHVFSAVVGREELIGRRLQEVAEKLCGGSVTPLLTHLVRQGRLSDAERQELRDLIDAPAPKPKKKEG
ncbi:MAG: BlaI/MecI/CopY family transcriptional regulator [Gemmataceae bacterium]|nr:BlaI/MecI/CopY family transcriptional regulator [Gemmataceae bacterium]